MSTFFRHSRLCFKYFFSRASRGGRGFTLIELMVVVALITIMTGVLLLQQKKFDSSTLLRSLAYSVALSMRQAQVYGTSVREFGSGSFNSNYGVYFFSGSGGTNNYYLFADGGAKDNQRASDGSEDVQAFKLGSGYSIVKFCATPVSGSEECTPTLSWLSVYFKRPNPDSFFAASSGGPYKDAHIQLSGPGGDTRDITITSTGQIRVCGVNKVYPAC